MKEWFCQLPAALRIQILLRTCIGAVAAILFAVIWVYSREFTFALPCLILAVFLFVNGAVMAYHIFIGSFICIHGVCTMVETTGIRKRIKSIIADFDGKRVVIPVKQRIRQVLPGKNITVYLSDKTPVYEKDGDYYIYSYYALALGEGGSDHDGI